MSAARNSPDSLGLGEGPISNMVGLLERKGVIVARLPAATEEVDAFSCWIGAPPRGPRLEQGRGGPSRFDAAHELGHSCYMPTPVQVTPSSSGRQTVSPRNFLSPASSILREFPPGRLARLRTLKVRWRVAISML